MLGSSLRASLCIRSIVALSPSPRTTCAPTSRPDHGRLRVVVAVHVRDQEPADVAHGVAELLEAGVEDLARLRDRPAAVDQHQPVVGLDDVDVDRTQPVHRQRQREPVHPGRDLEGTGLGPLAAPGSVDDSLAHSFTLPGTGCRGGQHLYDGPGPGVRRRELDRHDLTRGAGPTHCHVVRQRPVGPAAGAFLPHRPELLGTGLHVVGEPVPDVHHRCVVVEVEPDGHGVELLLHSVVGRMAAELVEGALDEVRAVDGPAIQCCSEVCQLLVPI